MGSGEAGKDVGQPRIGIARFFEPVDRLPRGFFFSNNRAANGRGWTPMVRL
jgi:hypothetical protein